MKKKYVKPVMGTDLFSLTQSIAASCGVNRDAALGYPKLTGKTVCAWDLGNYTIFLERMSVCEVELTEGEDFEVGAYCYNNPNGGTEIFGS